MANFALVGLTVQWTETENKQVNETMSKSDKGSEGNKIVWSTMGGVVWTDWMVREGL